MSKCVHPTSHTPMRVATQNKLTAWISSHVQAAKYWIQGVNMRDQVGQIIGSLYKYTWHLNVDKLKILYN